MKIKGTDQAFPITENEEGWGGMNIRTYLAGQALAGMGATFGVRAETVAAKAREIADATIKDLAEHGYHED